MHFQLSLSTAFHGHTAQRAATKENCRSLQRRTIMLSQAKFFYAQKMKELLLFYLLANPAQTTYLSVQDRELSNTIPLVEIRRRKIAVHTFFVVVQS